MTCFAVYVGELVAHWSKCFAFLFSEQYLLIPKTFGTVLSFGKTYLHLSIHLINCGSKKNKKTQHVNLIQTGSVLCGLNKYNIPFESSILHFQGRHLIIDWRKVKRYGYY